MKRILKWLFPAVCVLILGCGGFAGFEIYRVYYGRLVYETVPPKIPQLSDPAILVFSKTNAFREDDAVKAANEYYGASRLLCGTTPAVMC